MEETETITLETITEMCGERWMVLELVRTLQGLAAALNRVRAKRGDTPATRIVIELKSFEGWMA